MEQGVKIDKDIESGPSTLYYIGRTDPRFYVIFVREYIRSNRGKHLHLKIERIKKQTEV